MRANGIEHQRARPIVPRGVTVIELLVIIGIIGLLVAVTLPAVQRARESARRLQCQSNLRQIGIALHAYQSANDVFPAGSGGALFLNPGGSARSFSPFTFLLPELEQQSLFNAVNFEVRAFDPDPVWDGPENRTVFGQRIELFVCPSDPYPSGGPGGRNNYRVNLGTGPKPFPPTNNGAFPPTTWNTPAAFTDGLSFTAAVSEKIKGDGVSTQYFPSGDIWDTQPQGSEPSLEQLAVLCAAPPVPVPPHYSFGGSSWFHAGFRWTWYNHGLTPNHSIPDCTTAVHAGAIPGLFSARSVHSGGVNVMMMDGSVRFVSDSVDISTWRALATRAGCEQVEPPF